MKIEKARVPLAELRVILGKTQPEMAEIIGVSLPTIQSIETTRMRLSEKLAGRVSFETGVNMEWLCRRLSSKNHPPIDRESKPYTRETFAKYVSASEETPSAEKITDHITQSVTILTARVAAMLLAAHASNEYLLCRFKLHQEVAELEKRFDRDKSRQRRMLLLSKLLRATPLLDKEAITIITDEIRFNKPSK